jgi:tetratricopeptide (TPR) repeat protein
MSMEAQLQMRHNVEEMHSAFRELSDWTSDIEGKDRALRGIEPKRTKRPGGAPPSSADRAGHRPSSRVRLELSLLPHLPAGRDQVDEEEEEAREIAEARAELARLALEDGQPARAAVAQPATASPSGGGSSAAAASAAHDSSAGTSGGGGSGSHNSSGAGAGGLSGGRGSATSPHTSAGVVGGAAGVSVGPPSCCGATNFDKWRNFDADGAVQLIDSREAVKEALRLKVTKLENGRAQAALRRRQGAAAAEAEALKARGNACFGSARYEDAVADYTEALERRPSSATLYANRAMALLKVRREEKLGGKGEKGMVMVV